MANGQTAQQGKNRADHEILAPDWLITCHVTWPNWLFICNPIHFNCNILSGLNAIQTYVAWNSHEPSPGVYNWAGSSDLIGFIELVNAAEMPLILRVIYITLHTYIHNIMS